MGWAKFDDNRHQNPKLRRAGLEASCLDSYGITYAAAIETDGFLDETVVPLLAGVKHWRKLVVKLVEEKRWERDDTRCGWWIHDYLEYNPSREQIAAQRDTWTTRAKAGASARWNKDDATKHANSIAKSMQEAAPKQRESYAPTRPDPLRIKEVFKESKDSLNPSWLTQGKRDEQENPVEDLANSASRNEAPHVQIPTAEKQDPQDLVGETIPKAQPLPISDVPAVDISTPESLTTSAKSRKPRKRDLVFEAIAEVCGINWRSTTESELVLVRKSRREIGNANGTPEEVYRKAAIYHRMMPNVILTPMSLVKYWSRLEEKNIPKTSAELKNEDLERTFASYEIPVMAQEATNGSTNDHGSSDVSSDAMETAFPSDSTTGTSYRDAIVESQAPNHADISSPQSPTMGRQNAPDAHSGRRLGFEYGFQPNGSQNTSNRSPAPLTGKSEVPPEPLTPNGSLQRMDRTEPQVTLASERPSGLSPDADAERRRIAAKSVISELAKQKQMADPKSSAWRTSVPDGATVVYEDEPLPEYHGSYEDDDMQDYQQEPIW